jgi:hypothetical protein
MKIGAPRVKPMPSFKIPKVAQPIVHAPPKPFKPVVHPHQDRLEQHRTLPSLVTDQFKNPIKEGEKA